MKLYQTPGGTIAGTEKDWTKAMKAEGIDPKTYKGRSTFEFPTGPKSKVMEWLTFHNVNLISPQHPATGAEVAPAGTPSPPSSPGGTSTTMSDLDAMFAAAPLRKQTELAVALIDRMEKQLGSD